jgi:membrane protein
MHADPQRVEADGPRASLGLPTKPRQAPLAQLTLRLLHLFARAIWRAFQHDAFAIAKASAYSSILTFFPTLLVVGSILGNGNKTMREYSREISYALERILPAGFSTVQAYLRGNNGLSVGLLATTSALAVWLASGVMVSWMEGFRRSYELPKVWGLVKERLIAFALVILAGIPLVSSTVLVAFGSKIESIIVVNSNHEIATYVLIMWKIVRWLIAILTSVAVIALIYHNAVPRTQPWHSVLPGATLATALWFIVTMLFGWYLQNYADYSLIYGSLGVAIALLVWMYLISLVILIGAEFNAMLFPRSKLGSELTELGGAR